MRIVKLAKWPQSYTIRTEKSHRNLIMMTQPPQYTNMPYCSIGHHIELPLNQLPQELRLNMYTSPLHISHLSNTTRSIQETHHNKQSIAIWILPKFRNIALGVYLSH